MTTTIPIIYSVVVDPVSDGLTTSLERPGGNMTGVTSFDPNQARTHVDLLRLVSPKLSRVAVLSDKGVSQWLSNSNDQAIRERGLSSQILRVLGPEPDLDEAFAAMKREQADALIAVMILFRVYSSLKTSALRSPIQVQMAVQGPIHQLYVRGPNLEKGELSSLGAFWSLGNEPPRA